MIAGHTAGSQGSERRRRRKGVCVRPREVPPQFLRISWEVTDPQGESVAIEALLCLQHRQEIASRFPGVRGTGQRGESCDLCQIHSRAGLLSSGHLGPRTGEADTDRLLSTLGRAIRPGLGRADGARGGRSRWASGSSPDVME
jgi:hypothetical protein